MVSSSIPVGILDRLRVGGNIASNALVNGYKAASNALAGETRNEAASETNLNVSTSIIHWTPDKPVNNRNSPNRQSQKQEVPI